ncbi:unnamed protein product [Heligmosomoides polygyrus]|uniref:Secreted protein n=1 Tax=Heligmosomoides polygyrus TaxID=6339 RepID=A0A183GH33_HELPZ|nr:unnamed protein product [Heligmosomoides polygyrus]
MWQRVVATLLVLLQHTTAYLGPKMGVQNQCDDGKTNLFVDWNPEDFSAFTCTGSEFPVRQDVISELFELRSQNASFDPKTDVVYHKCMSETIQYEAAPPLR